MRFVRTVASPESCAVSDFSRLADPAATLVSPIGKSRLPCQRIDLVASPQRPVCADDRQFVPVGASARSRCLYFPCDDRRHSLRDARSRWESLKGIAAEASLTTHHSPTKHDRSADGNVVQEVR